MIDVKSTIFKTINDTFDRMRLLGQNDPKLFKKIMYLIVLDDIYDWSDYLDENQSVQKRLQDLRTNFIQCNPEFTICRFPFDQHYVNVNTPQTNYTWKRVWDSPEVIIFDSDPSKITPSTTPWTPDPTCEISIVYFDGESAPEIDVTHLTTCEKMNLYINRETGEMWYLDTNCIWKRVNPEDGMTRTEVIELLSEYRINQEWTDSTTGPEIELSLVHGSGDNKMKLLTEEDVEEMV